jgi:predicted nucleic acid-binding protein
MLVIDSSAIVKYFSKEEGWESLQDKITEGSTIQFALVELANALMNKVLDRKMGIGLAHVVMEEFAPQIPLLDQGKYAISAFDISKGNDLSFYDGLFIATAMGEGCDLLTCDPKQADVAKKLGLRVIEA